MGAGMSLGAGGGDPPRVPSWPHCFLDAGLDRSSGGVSPGGTFPLDVGWNDPGQQAGSLSPR